MDKEARNCLNRLGLHDNARAVTSYTEDVKEELSGKKAKKVFGLGDLRLYECPLCYLTWDTYQLMRVVYLIDSSGHLLYGDAWAFQPYWLFEAYEIYKAEHAENTRRLNNL